MGPQFSLSGTDLERKTLESVPSVQLSGVFPQLKQQLVTSVLKGSRPDREQRESAPLHSATRDPSSPSTRPHLGGRMEDGRKIVPFLFYRLL